MEDINKIKEELLKQDDDSIECISVHPNGKYYKTINRYPYRAIEITKDEYDSIVESGQLTKTETTVDILEFYAR
jgi:hypothetical protein